MTKRSGLIIAIILLITIGTGINSVFSIENPFNERSETSLLNQYFKLKDTHPEEAKRALERLLEQDPKNPVAMREMGYWYIRQGDTNAALKQFLLAYNAHPDDQHVALELGKLYILTGQYDKAYEVLSQLTNTTDLDLKQQVQIALNQLPPMTIPHTVTVSTTSSLPVKHIEKKIEKLITDKSVAQAKQTVNKTPVVVKTSQRDTLFNQYYALKKTNPKQAWVVLQQILKRYPNDVDALKEAGYTTLNDKNNAEAFVYFKHAYEITGDPQLAMQLGYILVNLNEKKLAYYYFNLATQTKDTQRLINAEMAKTNLAQDQMKMLPEPYYLDFFYDPFYYSRFKLVVTPLVMRIGKLLEEEHQFKAYFVYRRTTDNQSNFDQTLPQIFEDNVSITDLGVSLNPFPKIPLNAFMEAGKAVDIVYQNRSRWRNDFRTGLTFYQDWGERPSYTVKPTFLSDKLLGDLYADMIYFTRYQDTIGSIRLREGIRIFKYETSSVDLYLKGFLVWDTQHQFYNNIFEWGPGIAITPTNRLNIVLHLETLQGHYIPVNSPTPNPYSSNYHNNLILFNVYLRV